MPSTKKNKFLFETVLLELNSKELRIRVYDTSLGKRWLSALEDNIKQKRLLEKNFCFLGWPDSKRDLRYLVAELNKNIEQINSYTFNPPYERIDLFSQDDFQFSSNLPIGKAVDGDANATPGKRLKHEACNLLHRYFEELQGTAWKTADYYKQADIETKYSIRQLNLICHEIESWVNADRKKAFDPEWMRPAQITTFLNAPRYDLYDEDYQLFKQNRYDRQLGGVYLHWSQVGKTLYEVFRDEHAPKMTDALCSEINHQKFYSGEFDVEWGQTVTEQQDEFKKIEMEPYRKWLAENNYDWEDPKLSLGYIKLGQIDIYKTFGNRDIIEIHNIMSRNLNIKKIKINSESIVECDYDYPLDDDNWRQIQMEGLKSGYK